MTKHLYLIDGSGFIFRAFFGYPRMNRTDGTPTNAVYGFCVMVNKLIAETDADLVGVIFDKGRTTFRNDIYPDYKANREDAPEDLVPQFALIHEACTAYNIPSLDMQGFEADDLIATYAKMGEDAGYKVSIVSSDKDLMQLVNDKITLYDAMKNKTIGRDEVLEKFGVYPEAVVDVQALAGDSSDNVPGVPGIGVKTASLLINTYGNLESLLERAGEITQQKRRENLIAHADDARMSKKLVRLCKDVPVEHGLEFFARRQYDDTVLRDFLLENNFKRLLSVLDASQEHIQESPTSPPSAPPTNTDNTAISDGVSMSPSTPYKDVPTDYTCIQDASSLQKWLAPVYESGVLAVDTETTGLHIMDDHLVGISLATTAGRACYIPLAHLGDNGGESDILNDDLFASPTCHAPRQLHISEVVEILHPIFTDARIVKVGHNLKFDMSILAPVGLHMTPFHDTMLMSYVLDAGREKHGLDALAQSYYNHTMIAFKNIAGTGQNAKKFDAVSLDDATPYASEDADFTWRLYHTLYPRLVPENVAGVYGDIERKLVPVIHRMEQNGVVVDTQKLSELSAEFGAKMAMAEQAVKTIVDTYDGVGDFNIASPAQLGVFLFEILGLKGGKKTKTGAYSTTSDILASLKLPTDDSRVVVENVLMYRTYAKLKSTYTDALQHQISKQTQRVHTSFNMVGAMTGRLSSSDPNLQNIPARGQDGQHIRTCFVAETGNVLLSLDYSQIELRIMAHMAGDPTMIQAFQDGQDIHRASASKMFKIPMDAVSHDLRQKAKIINFGIIYDVSAFGLAQQVGCSRTEASTFIKEYFAQFPYIQDYMNTAKQNAEADGFVSTLFGRKMYLSGIHTTGVAKSHAFRQAINAPIQGTSADIIKRAMVQIDYALQSQSHVKPDTKPLGKMILQVHDELIFETSPDNAQALMDLVKPIMENACYPLVDLSVPLVVDGQVADNWADAH